MDQVVQLKKEGFVKLGETSHSPGLQETKKWRNRSTLGDEGWKQMKSDV